ncbi:hypothetical protein ACWIYZ_03000 [Ursidibacter arcticus]
MESLTINFCYSLADQEIKIANIEKLELLLCLCDAKLGNDIDLPFKRVIIIGTDYITNEYSNLIKSLNRIVSQSRKIGVSFTVWEKEPQDTSDFKLNF